MHERDVWAGVLAVLLATVYAANSVDSLASSLVSEPVWMVSLLLVAASWGLDRRLGFDGEVAILGPLATGALVLLVVETPPEQMFLNGVVRSGIFALGAVGLTLVYGILNLVNFAHGDLLTAGGYFAWLVATPAFGVSISTLGLVLLIPLVSVLVFELAAEHLPAGWSRSTFFGFAALSALGWAVLPGGLLWALGLLVVGLAGFDRLDAERMQTPDRWTLALGCVLVAAVVALTVALDAFWVTMVGSLVVAAATVALVSVGLDRTLWTRMRDRNANLLTLMIVSIGVAFALRSSLQLGFGGEIRVFFEQAAGQSQLARQLLSYVGLGDLRVTTIDVWIVVTTVVAIVSTSLVMRRTRVGKAMRALADNQDLARVAGIDTERVITYVWVLGGALAGIAGALLAMETSLHGNLGWRALLPLFAVVILGGVGSVPGAMLGGLVVGMAQSLSVHWLGLAGLDTSYNIAVGFLILIVTLIVRPRGIMGVGQA